MLCMSLLILGLERVDSEKIVEGDCGWTPPGVIQTSSVLRLACSNPRFPRFLLGWYR
jgi:hypothetical protein